jgi:REP element-mobilizing transposase RayT
MDGDQIGRGSATDTGQGGAPCSDVGPLPTGCGKQANEREARTYLLTYHTYGTWLHGDERRSVDRHHNIPETETLPPDARRYGAARARLKHGPTLLDACRRRIVEATIREVCAYRGWHLHAVNVRTNHVHVVVSASVPPEKVLTDLKAWATRRMVEARAISPGTKVWSRHGSTRYLWTDRSIDDACQYVVEGQGIDLLKDAVRPSEDETGPRA